MSKSLTASNEGSTVEDVNRALAGNPTFTGNTASANSVNGSPNSSQNVEVIDGVVSENTTPTVQQAAATSFDTSDDDSPDAAANSPASSGTTVFDTTGGDGNNALAGSDDSAVAAVSSGGGGNGASRAGVPVSREKETQVTFRLKMQRLLKV